MADLKDKPLLLLNNSNMMSVLNEGEFKCSNMSFEETKAIIEMYDKDEILLCFSSNDVQTIFDYLGIQAKDFTFKSIRNMRVGQDAIVFKRYITPSLTEPVIQADDGVEAKKIQNVYIYCQHLSRVK